MAILSPILLFGCMTVARLSFAQLSTATLTTTLGVVAGSMVTHNQTNVSVFYGIQYGRPPIGSLRFLPPQPAQPWQGTRDANTLPNSCWQTIDTSFNRTPNVEMWNVNTNRSEDCLYLNVWIPATNDTKAIMVWIYGGGFWGGTSTLNVYNALILAARTNVIVVSFNYRVGALGFLYCGTPNCPGNAGLLDQVLALKWVKDNAVNMGGDPARITIFGESAGAASVGFHLLSPLSVNLFTNAMMMSASPTVFWGLQSQEVALNRSKTLASILGSSSQNIDDTVTYLRNVNPQLLVETQWKLSYYYFDAPFAAVVDGTFLPKHPLELMSEGKVKNTTLIMGVVKNEGTYWLLYGFPSIFGNHNPNPVSSSQYDTVVSGVLQPMGKNFTTSYVKDFTIDEYYNALPPWREGSYLDSCDAVSGDTLFKCPVVNFAQYYTTKVKGQVFMYSFEHRVSTNLWPLWLGVAHGYELEIFFGRPWSENGDNYTDSERVLSDDVMNRITNLAKTGDPNSDTMIPTVIWPKYTHEHQLYLVINTNQTHVNQGLRQRECGYWQTQVPILQDAAYSRLPCTDSTARSLAPQMTLYSLSSIVILYYKPKLTV